MTRFAPLVLLVAASPLTAADRADVLVADFEGDTYADGWKTTGTAFGKGPARGALPNQMPVSGFLGKGLVNSFAGGDDSTGTLTSPEFTIDRKHINFLIGGGKHPGKTCVNLLVDGKVVRTATGPNDKAGGTEHLDWHTWDVAEFAGKKAIIEIVDEQKGGWGHINVDHIVQSDTKKQAELMTREFDIGHPYLHLPVKTGAPMRRVKFVVGKSTVREFDIELALGVPDFWATSDVTAFKGKKLTVEVTLPSDADLAKLIAHSDTWANADKLYQEKHRPLFHFTSRVGWLNDPNGLVYADGEWHLYYQHNPFGREWGNMHWGHATSKDLFRWKEQPIALYPKKYGDWAFSGSAIVDKENTSGWGTKEQPAARARLHQHRARRVHRVQHGQGPHLARVRRQPGGEARRPRPEARVARADEEVGDGRVRRVRRRSSGSRSTRRRTSRRGRSRAASRASSSARTCSSYRSRTRC